MKKILIKPTLLLFAVFYNTILLAQYTGGSSHGFIVANYFKQSFTDANAFKGGTDDGFATIIFNKQNPIDANAFKGGADDGFAAITFNKQNPIDANAFRGGANDGFAEITFNKQETTDANAFKGGADDGFAAITFINQNPTDANAFKGGGNDGFAFALYVKNTVLPITLNSFTGNWLQNNAVLYWQTSSEINTAKFIIERSFTGADFLAIDTTIAAGNSTTIKNYTYTDANVAKINASQRHFFYRIKTIDKDGKQSYSAIILLIKSADTNLNITLYPNPANSYINISIDKLSTNNTYTIMLRDVLGKLITEKKMSTNTEKLHTYQLPTGQYLITIYDSKQIIKTIPIIIQH